MRRRPLRRTAIAMLPIAVGAFAVLGAAARQVRSSPALLRPFLPLILVMWLVGALIAVTTAVRFVRSRRPPRG